MTDPITPPLGWVLDLLNEARKRAKSSGCFGEVDYVYMVNKSAQMGWDQRGAVNEAELLEACCELVPGLTNYLRAARRPNPPSLKEQALEAQRRMWSGASNHDDWDLVRRALEQLPD